MKDSKLSPILKELQNSFEAGDYHKFHKILLANKSKFDQNIFHYNLGLFYYYTKNFPVGRLHFEKAKSFGKEFPQLARIIKETEKKIPQVSWEKESWAQISFNHLLAVQKEYFILGALGLLLVFVLIVLKKKFRRVAVLIPLCGLTFFYFGLFILPKFKRGVVIKETVGRVGPSRIFKEKSFVPGGLKVLVRQSHDEWVKIIFPKKLSSWVKKGDIGLF